MSNYNSDNYFNYKYQNSINILILKFMNMIAELKNGENVLTVDCQNKKMYFNGNEVIKIAAETRTYGLFYGDPQAFIELMANVEAGEKVTEECEVIQEYLDNHFQLCQLIYKDNTNKQHIIIDDFGEWRECDNAELESIRNEQL